MEVRFLKVVTLVALLTACADTTSVRFPVDQTDIDNGKQAFIDHRCNQCHSVAGVDLPPVAGESPVQFRLGGKVDHLKSYGELITSIINPNHVISEEYREQLLLDAEVPVESPMPPASIDHMTVRQLIDLVAFLDSTYSLANN